MPSSRQCGERGSVLPWAAAALAGAALLGLWVARDSRMRWERLRVRTAADATVLAAATAYGRGLNVAAASNQVLFMAAAADAALLLVGEGEAAKAVKLVKGLAGVRVPASFTELVTDFQDAWAGTWGDGVAAGAARTGLAAATMAAAVSAVGLANDLTILTFWNPGGVAVPLMPELRVRRATPAEVAALFGGTRLASQGREQRPRYSYRDEKTGTTTEVDAADVELLRFMRSGREVVQARMKEGAGNLAGKFLRTEKMAAKAMKFLDIPRPLLERSRVHTVLVLARPRRGGAAVAACAMVHGGAVFSDQLGTPTFDVRLVPEPPVTGLVAAAGRLLGGAP